MVDRQTEIWRWGSNPWLSRNTHEYGTIAGSSPASPHWGMISGYTVRNWNEALRIHVLKVAPLRHTDSLLEKRPLDGVDTGSNPVRCTIDDKM